MTTEPTKISTNWKIFIIAGVLINLGAIAYMSYMVYQSGDYSGIGNLTMMGVLFINMLIFLRIGMKRKNTTW